MAIVAGVILLLLTAVVYFRNLQEAGWLVLLRFAAVVLLVAILADWAPSIQWTTKPRRVVMLIDRSRSMSAVGADTVASSVIQRFPVAADRQVEVWTFGDSARRMSGIESATADDRRTKMGRALRIVTRTRPGAVVLVSDGQDNGDLDPVQVARDAGIPVYTVGCGRAGTRNIEVVSVTLPLEVYVGDTVTVFARLRYEGIDEEVSIRLGHQTQRVRLHNEAAEQEFSFRTVFASPGRQLIRVSVDSLPGESDYLDNERLVPVEVKSSRVKVAYVTNRPGFGTRFLLGALRQLEWIELSEVVQTVAGSRWSVTDVEAGVDVFLLDGISEQGDYLEGVVRQVRQGAGVLLIGGPDFKPGKVLAELLPSKSGVTSRAGDYVPALTSTGRLFSWLAEIRFDEVPPFVKLFEPEGLAGTEVWLVAGQQSRPVILAYDVGGGRAVYVAGYPLWRWGFGPERKSGQNSLQLFLAGVIRYLAEQDRERFRLVADKPTFHFGERVRLMLSARAPGGEAWSGLDALVAVDSSPSVPMVEKGSGVYEVELGAVGVGVHRAEATVMMGDSILEKVTAEFVVSEREIELANTGLNRELLAAIAQASGASFFRWDSLPQEGFEPTLAVIRRRLGFEPRRSPWAYVLVALLIGVELVLRRRKGLL